MPNVEFTSPEFAELEPGSRFVLRVPVINGAIPVNHFPTPPDRTEIEVVVNEDGIRIHRQDGLGLQVQDAGQGDLQAFSAPVDEIVIRRSVDNPSGWVTEREQSELNLANPEIFKYFLGRLGIAAATKLAVQRKEHLG